MTEPLDDPNAADVRTVERRVVLGVPFGEVLAFEDSAREPVRGIVLWHGAGSDADEAALAGLASRLARAGWRVVRPRFPYRERAAVRGRTLPPDRLPALVAAADATLAALGPAPGGAAWFVGGRSLGARVACHLAAIAPDEGAPRLLPAGVLACSYPLAPPRGRRPRAHPFAVLAAPALFVQGTRDPFGGPEDLSRALAAAGRRVDGVRIAVVAVQGADHALRAPGERDGPGARTLDEITRTIAEHWPHPTSP